MSSAVTVFVLFFLCVLGWSAGSILIEGPSPETLALWHNIIRFKWVLWAAPLLFFFMWLGSKFAPDDPEVPGDTPLYSSPPPIDGVVGKQQGNSYVVTDTHTGNNHLIGKTRDGVLFIQRADHRGRPVRGTQVYPSATARNPKRAVGEALENRIREDRSMKRR